MYILECRKQCTFSNVGSLLLPTFEDVIRCCFQERFNLSIEAISKFVSFSKVAGIVGRKIKDVFGRASIPTVSEKRIVQLINAYYAKYCKLRRSYDRDKSKTFFKLKLDVFKEKSTLVFDVAVCKCPIVVECTCNKTPDLCECEISINCKSQKPNKIHAIELRFVYFQRNNGRGKIGGVNNIAGIHWVKDLELSE
ncbi:hypothetical protein AVEN_112649-1 [Araneus ventricosus]|uniref:Uncharacterized protein n=1 Tax=Araneus ventricosus TaxID=182803 RepID=A0A4Y2BT45_ARAVE|nr:hypothetical protein AVEN_112649-1 [Araneus ventricosus]